MSWNRHPFDVAELDRLAAFATADAVHPFTERLVRRLLTTLTTGPDAVIELRDGARTVALASVADAAPSQDRCGVLDVLALADGVSPAEALSVLLDHAEPWVAAGPLAGLELPLPGVLGPTTGALAARGYELAHVEYRMEATALTLPERTPLAAGWRWQAIEEGWMAAYHAAVGAAMRGVPGFYGTALPEFTGAVLAASPRDEVLVTADGEVAGFASIRLDGDQGEVRLVGRHPRWRGAGLGPHVLGRACERLGALGATSWALDVVAVNATALGLYRRSGFEVVESMDVLRRWLPGG